MAARRKKPVAPVKAIDEEHRVRCAAGLALRREEVWIDEEGQVVHYNLALICPELWAGDNGRVLGYDNSHGVHHRHYKGATEAVDFKSYGAVAAKFFAELAVLREEKR